MPPARVVLAEDNASVAERIREVLQESFEVVRVVSSGEALERAFLESAPDAVVADIMMPGEGGLVAMRKILERNPGTPVVLLSVLDTRLMIRVGLSSGAQGYVVKDDAADELVRAVDAALKGEMYVSASARRALGTSA